jgi:hypothetical protein
VAALGILGLLGVLAWQRGFGLAAVPPASVAVSLSLALSVAGLWGTCLVGLVWCAGSSGPPSALA